MKNQYYTFKNVMVDYPKLKYPQKHMENKDIKSSKLEDYVGSEYSVVILLAKDDLDGKQVMQEISKEFGKTLSYTNGDAKHEQQQIQYEGTDEDYKANYYEYRKGFNCIKTKLTAVDGRYQQLRYLANIRDKENNLIDPAIIESGDYCNIKVKPYTTKTGNNTYLELISVQLIEKGVNPHPDTNNNNTEESEDIKFKSAEDLEKEFGEQVSFVYDMEDEEDKKMQSIFGE